MHMHKTTHPAIFIHQRVRVQLLAVGALSTAYAMGYIYPPSYRGVGGIRALGKNQFGH
jgi:hypothetical protein